MRWSFLPLRWKRKPIAASKPTSMMIPVIPRSWSVTFRKVKVTIMTRAVTEQNSTLYVRRLSMNTAWKTAAMTMKEIWFVKEKNTGTATNAMRKSRNWHVRFRSRMGTSTQRSAMKKSLHAARKSMFTVFPVMKRSRFLTLQWLQVLTVPQRRPQAQGVSPPQAC